MIKELKFDVEVIIDHGIRIVKNERVLIATHRKYRCLSLSELHTLLQENNRTPKDSDTEITINIRGVNY